ncbi:MAG: ribonuclease III [Planctomycetes bacterium]|nr:ribonuclease III [Planctomycetota bacterium]
MSAESDNAGTTLGGHCFGNQDLLAQALTHASCAEGQSNERLEFLGDAVLSMLVSLHLHQQFGDLAEGPMTKARSLVVNTRSLANKARELGLHRALRTGRMFPDHSYYSEAMLADALEAFLGALYLDAGIDAARNFVERNFSHELAAAAALPDGTDWKSQLHRVAQAGRKGNASYTLVSTAGEDHCRTFEVRACHDGKLFPAGYGRSRKEAEQCAARLALVEFGVD